MMEEKEKQKRHLPANVCLIVTAFNWVRSFVWPQGLVYFLERGAVVNADHSCCDLFSGVDLDCQAYAHDGYDCCLKDAQYLTTWNGTAPRCLADARGQVRTIKHLLCSKQQLLGC